jgi:formyl-CoA transferase
VKAGLPLTDLGASLFALAAILAAVHWRSSSGRGQYIDTSLFEAGLALSVWEATEYFSGRMPGPLGSAHRMTAPYQAFRCADGYVTVGAANDRTFARLASLLGHLEWLADPRFATDVERVRNREALAWVIEEVMSTATCADWLARLEAAGIPSGPINDYAQVFADPQVAARGMVVEVDHPTLGRMRGLGSPVKMSATPLDPRRRAPCLGEHTDEVLRHAGIGDDELREMRAARAIL